ncbi:conserved hypothetical protein [Candidatus Sulfopaludibacter sp. SbA4]|nr:conserved hypothetical protein [Candidatus Sulfopaludibacter sp. SbA4]
MNPLTLELLTWIASRPRTYAETMEAWRTNCPRHPVWEDACIEGLVEVVDSGPTSTVVLTPRGNAALAAPPLSLSPPSLDGQ